MSLGPIKPSKQWASGTLLPSVNRPGSEADHSRPSDAEATNAWRYISTPPYVFMASCLAKYRIRLHGTVQVQIYRLSIYRPNIQSNYSLRYFFNWLLQSLRTLAFLNGFLDPQTFGRTPWLGDQSNARPLPTHRTTQHRNTQTHPCPEQDSNLRSQCSSGRRQYMPQIARLLRPANGKYTLIKAHRTATSTCILEVLVRISDELQAILIQALRGLPPYLKANVWKVP
jgi:hypothetical protein